MIETIKYGFRRVPNPRTAEPEELKEVAETLGIPVAVENDPVNAVRQGFLTKTPDQGVFCVGSLYALPSFKKACIKAIQT